MQPGTNENIARVRRPISSACPLNCPKRLPARSRRARSRRYAGRGCAVPLNVRCAVSTRSRTSLSQTSISTICQRPAKALAKAGKLCHQLRDGLRRAADAPVIEDIRTAGANSLRSIAKELNERGIFAPRGGRVVSRASACCNGENSGAPVGAFALLALQCARLRRGNPFLPGISKIFKCQRLANTRAAARNDARRLDLYHR